MLRTTKSFLNIDNVFKEGPFHSIVVPVNTVGVMGAGFAKALYDFAGTKNIKIKYKDICCKECTDPVHPGDIRKDPYNRFSSEGYPNIYYAFTKDHWKAPSKVEWVEACYKALAELQDAKEAQDPCWEVRVMHVPLLGAGLGGLSAEVSLELAVKYLKPAKSRFMLYGVKWSLY